MMNSRSVLRVLSAALSAGVVFAGISASAMAADFGDMKDTPFGRAPAEHTITVNGGLTSDYVYRGISQSDNDPAAFAGMDLSYRMFYVGVWGSSVSSFTSSSGMELDVYGGIKKTFNGIDLDLGVVYYAYPGNNAVLELNYVELKAAASAKVWRDIALTGTVFYSPDYYSEAGETWTVEGKVSVPLRWWGLTLSGAYGYVTSDDDGGIFSATYGRDNYRYWNVGISKIFRERFTIDLRYWGTSVDVDGAVVANAAYLNGIADDRVLATLTFNY
jgi:uncharacterized protein (TIGR02001 family)